MKFVTLKVPRCYGIDPEVDWFLIPLEPFIDSPWSAVSWTLDGNNSCLIVTLLSERNVLRCHPFHLLEDA